MVMSSGAPSAGRPEHETGLGTTLKALGGRSQLSRVLGAQGSVTRGQPRGARQSYPPAEPEQNPSRSGEDLPGFWGATFPIAVCDP